MTDRVGVVGAGGEEGTARSREGVEGEEGRSGEGRDFLGREEDEVAGKLAFAAEGRFGVRGAGGPITGRFCEEEGCGDEEEEWYDERWTAGEENEASLSEGVTKLVNPGNRNRC